MNEMNQQRKGIPIKSILIGLFSACLILLILTACDKNESDKPDCPNITGEWEWIKFIGGFGGDTITPGDLGINKSIFIKADTFSLFINDTFNSSTTFICIIIQNSHFSLPSIKLENGEQYLVATNQDTLILTHDLALGGDRDIYTRK